MSGRIRIPPGGSATLEVTIGENGVVESRIVSEGTGTAVGIQDPLGGPPIRVSDQVWPDAMALYLLSTAIIDCSRALESHEAEIQQARETHLRVEAGYARATRWNKFVVAICGALLFGSLGSLAMSLWGHVHGW